tara:strand:+ start:107 stop:514 length:408 start_codon:yes stop_codon:yes gene_type:complete
MSETGRSISNADMRMLQTLIGRKGNSISNADKKMVQALIGSGGEMMKGLPKKLFNKDMKKIKSISNALKRGTKTTPFETGGEVPSKLKGFSKLPEPVQQKMNPSLAKKYEQGGEVKGHSRGRGAAIAGTKFIGVR